MVACCELTETETSNGSEVAGLYWFWTRWRNTVTRQWFGKGFEALSRETQQNKLDSAD